MSSRMTGFTTFSTSAGNYPGGGSSGIYCTLCKADIIFVKTERIMVSHAVEVKLRLGAFLSENDLCKIDIISAKTHCIMSEKKYWFLQK